MSRQGLWFLKIGQDFVLQDEVHEGPNARVADSSALVTKDPENAPATSFFMRLNYDDKPKNTETYSEARTSFVSSKPAKVCYILLTKCRLLHAFTASQARRKAWDESGAQGQPK